MLSVQIPKNKKLFRSDELRELKIFLDFIIIFYVLKDKNSYKSFFINEKKASDFLQFTWISLIKFFLVFISNRKKKWKTLYTFKYGKKAFFSFKKNYCVYKNWIAEEFVIIISLNIESNCIVNVITNISFK